MSLFTKKNKSQQTGFIMGKIGHLYLSEAIPRLNFKRYYSSTFLSIAMQIPVFYRNLTS